MRISYLLVAASSLVLAGPVMAQSANLGAGSVSVTSVGSTSSASCSGHCMSMAGGGAGGGGISGASASVSSGHHGTTVTTTTGSVGGVIEGGGTATSGRGGTASQSSSAGGLYGAGAVATARTH